MARPVEIEDSDHSDSPDSTTSNQDYNVALNLRLNGNIISIPLHGDETISLNHQPARRLSLQEREQQIWSGYLLSNVSNGRRHSNSDIQPRVNSDSSSSNHQTSHRQILQERVQHVLPGHFLFDVRNGRRHSCSDIQPRVRSGSSSSSHNIQSPQRNSFSCTNESFPCGPYNQFNRCFSLESLQHFVPAYYSGRMSRRHYTYDFCHTNCRGSAVRDNEENSERQIDEPRNINSTEDVERYSGCALVHQRNFEQSHNTLQTLSVIEPDLFLWFLSKQMAKIGLDIPDNIKVHEHFVDYSQADKFICSIIDKFSYSVQREQIFCLASLTIVPSSFKSFVDVINGLQKVHVDCGVEHVVALMFFCSDLAIKLFTENEDTRFYQICWAQSYFRKNVPLLQQRRLVKSSDSTIKVAITACMVGLVAVCVFMHHSSKHL